MKLIMVDLDGTLFDTKEVNYYAYKEAIKTYGYTIDYQYYCEKCNGKHYLDFLPQITTKDRVILSEIHKRKKEAYTTYLSYAKVNRPLVDIINTCKENYKIVLVTTASKKNTYDILERFCLTDMFDLILTQEDITKTKPDPEGFLIAMRTFEAKPEECIVFEDSDVGIEAARRSGAGVFVVKGYN